MSLIFYTDEVDCHLLNLHVLAVVTFPRYSMLCARMLAPATKTIFFQKYKEYPKPSMYARPIKTFLIPGTLFQVQ